MSTLSQQQPTTHEPAPALVARLRATFDSGRTRPLTFRQQQLAGLARFLKERERDIQDALHQDLGRPPLEAFTGDIAHPASELAFVRKHLAKWVRPERVSTPLVVQPGKSYIYREPLGVVLII